MLADVFGEKLPDVSLPEPLSSAAPPEIAAGDAPKPLNSLTSEWQRREDDPTLEQVSALPENDEEQQPQENLLRRNVDVALQNDELDSEDLSSRPRRQHGGALPRL